MNLLKNLAASAAMTVALIAFAESAGAHSYSTSTEITLHDGYTFEMREYAGITPVVRKWSGARDYRCGIAAVCWVDHEVQVAYSGNDRQFFVVFRWRDYFGAGYWHVLFGLQGERNTEYTVYAAYAPRIPDFEEGVVAWVLSPRRSLTLRRPECGRPENRPVNYSGAVYSVGKRRPTHAYWHGMTTSGLFAAALQAFAERYLEGHAPLVGCDE